MRRLAAAVLFVLLGLVGTGCAAAGSGSAGGGSTATTGPPTHTTGSAAPTPPVPTESGSITVDGIADIASYCQQGTPLLVRTITRR
jgi:hypothetical protein